MMEDIGFGIGVLLAIFGPLLLVPIAWLVYRLVVRPIVFHALAPRISGRSVRWIALALSLLIVTGALCLSYFPGKREFERLCSMHATPTVSDRVRTDGYYRTRLYPYEAKEILEGEDPFLFVEAPHMYKKGTFVRYAKTGTNRISEQEVAALKSRYGVRADLKTLPFGIVMSEKVVYEMETGRELARAADLVYEGGPLSLFLGTYGMSSCPDIRSPEGAQHFDTFYNLEKITLRAPARRGI